MDLVDFSGGWDVGYKWVAESELWTGRNWWSTAELKISGGETLRLNKYM